MSVESTKGGAENPPNKAAELLRQWREEQIDILMAHLGAGVSRQAIFSFLYDSDELFFANLERLALINFHLSSLGEELSVGNEVTEPNLCRAMQQYSESYNKTKYQNIGDFFSLREQVRQVVSGLRAFLLLYQYFRPRENGVGFLRRGLLKKLYVLHIIFGLSISPSVSNLLSPEDQEALKIYDKNPKFWQRAFGEMETIKRDDILLDALRHGIEVDVSQQVEATIKTEGKIGRPQLQTLHKTFPDINQYLDLFLNLKDGKLPIEFTE